MKQFLRPNKKYLCLKMLTDGWTTDEGVTGIQIAHLGAFCSGELKISLFWVKGLEILGRVGKANKKKILDLSENYNTCEKC